MMASGSVKKDVPKKEMSSSSHHWGEFITPVSSSSSSSKTTSVSSIESPSLKPKTIAIDPPRPHQPTTTQPKQNRLQPLAAELCRPDQLSLNTIQLLKQNRRIRCAMTQHPNDPSKYDDKSNVPLLSSPPLFNAEKKYSAELDAMASVSVPKIPIVDGTVEIDSSVARQLGRRAVATICSHSGYETIQESSLETLTDVLQEYQMKVCKLLRAAVDREALTGYTGFQDVLAQVLQEIGIGSTETLYNFWKTRIKDYNVIIQQRNAKLKEQFESKRNPSLSSMGEDSKSPRVKDESFSDIQFPDANQEHEIPGTPATPASSGSGGETPSQPQTLTFTNADLEEAVKTGSSITVTAGDGGVQGGQWQYIKTELVEKESRNTAGESTAGESATSEQNGNETSSTFVSESPNIVDIVVTSPTKSIQSSSQELASPPPPKKKRKKSGSTASM